MTQFEEDLQKLLYEATRPYSKDYEMTYSEFVEKYESIFNQTTRMRELVKNETHRCDFGCDNDCDMDGTLYRFQVEDLKNILNEIGERYNEGL